jgi:cytochrome P450
MATSALELTDLIDLTQVGDSVQARVDALRAATANDWLARGMFGFAVWRYADVTAILRDKRWHSAAGKVAEVMGITDERFLARNRQNILTAEGDEHTRLRRLVAPAFSPRSADRLRPFMRQVINDLVDPVAAAGRADIARDICEPYPIPIICELLGAPKSDWKLFSRWANDILEVFSFDVVDKVDLIVQTQDELDAYTRQLIADRRHQPADDLLTDLIAAEEAGDRLSEDELVMLVNAVIIGGTDTTRNQLGCCVALFAEHPDQWALLGHQPELAARAVDESMRYFGAVRGTARFAAEDIEYRGVHFPAGTFINIGLGEANRDATVMQHPDRFDIAADAQPAAHMTLGSGIHYCLGASLARAELQEALPILAKRMPNLAVDGAVTWKPDGVGIFGPERLPVTFSQA